MKKTQREEKKWKNKKTHKEMEKNREEEKLIQEPSRRLPKPVKTWLVPSRRRFLKPEPTYTS